MLSSLFKYRKAAVLAVALTALAVGGVLAYFTSQVTIPIGILKTAKLSVSAEAGEVFSAEQWLPGEEKTATWSITNTGTVPVFVKGFLSGSWTDLTLDSSVVSLVRVERLDNGSWVALSEDQSLLNAEFFHSNLGNEVDLIALLPAEVVQFRITTQLDAATTDDFQLQDFTAELHVAARQVTDGAIWPIAY